MNSVIITGHLGRDPETRYTSSGKGVCNFSVAVDGKRDETLWLNVSCWDTLATNVQQYCKKGMKVLVQGRLQIRKYQKDGVDKTATEVVAYTVEFLTPKQSPENGQTSDADEDTPF